MPGLSSPLPLCTDCGNLFQALPPAGRAQFGRLKSRRKSPCLHPLCLCPDIPTRSNNKPQLRKTNSIYLTSAKREKKKRSGNIPVLQVTSENCVKYFSKTFLRHDIIWSFVLTNTEIQEELHQILTCQVVSRQTYLYSAFKNNQCGPKCFTGKYQTLKFTTDILRTVCL